MRKAKTIGWLSVLCILLSSLALYLTCPGEPRYHGRSFSRWLALATRTWPDETEAADAVRQIGANGVPTLVAMMKGRHSARKETVIRWVNETSWLHVHVKTALELKSDAYIGFDFLGPKASSAIPSLAQILEHETHNSDSMDYAIRSLAAIGAAAVPFLTQALTNRNSTVRFYAAFGVRCIADERFFVVSYSPERLREKREARTEAARIAVPVLLAGLSDEDGTAQIGMAAALGVFRELHERIVPALIELLARSRSPSVSVTVITVLGEFGPDARAAIPQIRRFLQVDSPSVQQAATTAIAKISGTSPNTIRAGPGANR